MRNPFTHSFPFYFRKHFSQQLGELYLSVAILDFALAAVILFEPVYLYQLGYSISHIMLYYIVVYVLYFFLAPVGGMFVARRGPERSIALSTLMLVGYYGSLLLVPNVGFAFWVAPVFLALQKMLYWPAYHTDFIQSSDQGERGKEYSGLWSVSTVMFIIGPLLGGAIITYFGFPILFGLVIGMILLSNIPLFIEKIPFVPQGYSYWDSLKFPFTKRHIRSLLAYIGFGEELILYVIWPIFIAIVFHDYLSLGSIVAFATFITALITLYIGKVIDRGRWRRVLRWGSFAAAIVWLTRPFLRAIPLVFLSDTFGRIAKNTTFVTLSDQTYERALGEKNVIERSVFYEQGIALGKVLIAAAVIILASHVSPFTAAFLLAGAFSLLYIIF